MDTVIVYGSGNDAGTRHKRLVARRRGLLPRTSTVRIGPRAEIMVRPARRVSVHRDVLKQDSKRVKRYCDAGVICLEDGSRRLLDPDEVLGGTTKPEEPTTENEKSEAEPKPSPDTKPEPKKDVSPSGPAETTTESKPETSSETAPEPKADPKPEPEPEPKAESKPVEEETRPEEVSDKKVEDKSGKKEPESGTKKVDTKKSDPKPEPKKKAEGKKGKDTGKRSQ